MEKIVKQRNQWTKPKWMRDKIYEKYKVIGRCFCLDYYQISDYQINQIILENCRPTKEFNLGYKVDAYHTENEMINGFSCTYEQLSESEKLIWNGKA
jgi:hypothetical protein